MDVLTQLFGGANVVVAIAAALAAGLLRGFSGFGSAMLMAPIFAILFGSADMVATVVAMELAISFHLFPAARRDCDWTVVAPMTIAACIAMPLGPWLLVNLQLLLLALMFGVGIVGTAALPRAAVLFPFMLAGSWLGVRLFRGADERFYRRVALALLLAVGVFGMLR